jgi:hypothetical protein
MALNQFIDSALTGPISTVRRQAIGIVIAAAAGIGALYYFLAAANLALEPIVGPVYSRAIIGASFVVVAIVALSLPRQFRSRSIVEQAQADTKDMTRDQKFALIVEAVIAGFSLTSPSRSTKTPK